MIVPMKKVTFIVVDRDARIAVERIRKEGVLHVEHHRAPYSDDILRLQEDSALVTSALQVMRFFAQEPQAKQAPEKPEADWRTRARHILDLGKRAEQLEAYGRTLQGSINQWCHWGDFDPRLVDRLRAKGVRVKLYQLPVKQVAEFPSSVTVRVIKTVGGLAYCVALSLSDFQGPAKEIPLPAQGCAEMRARLQKDTRALQAIRDEIRSSQGWYFDLRAAQALLEKQVIFRQALAGMGKRGALTYLTGYVPAESIEQIRSLSRTEGWALYVQDPGSDDAVPTLLRNPRWVDIISPVFRLLEIIPGYAEFDISPLFLLFLGLFFGMIIGDAGYGAVYFLLTLLLHRKFARKAGDTRVFYLLYLFSSFAIFWGLLTGTVFGQEWYLKAGLHPLIPVLNDTKFIQAFCFFLGAFHLTLAQGWQGIRKLPSLVALADAGWICVLWSAFFIAKMLILDDPLPPWVKILAIAGVTLVVLFTNPSRNPLKTVGSGLGAVALNLMNNFTDVVSYVRLFAVGLAGVAIADTVNSLAAGFGSSNAVVAGVIVFIGHTINIVLGPMSVLVHGIRLNVLEFSGHAGLSWSGVAYRPLKD